MLISSKVLLRELAAASGHNDYTTGAGKHSVNIAQSSSVSPLFPGKYGGIHPVTLLKLSAKLRGAQAGEAADVLNGPTAFLQQTPRFIHALLRHVFVERAPGDAGKMAQEIIARHINLLSHMRRGERLFQMSFDILLRLANRRSRIAMNIRRRDFTLAMKVSFFKFAQ
jgi:hypothetical protein